MTNHDWIEAWKAHGGSFCDGLREGDPCSMECHLTGEPITNWCNDCIGWVAVCEMADQQRKRENAK